MTTRTVEADGWRVRLDTGSQVLGVEVPEVASGRESDLSPAALGPDPAAVPVLTACQLGGVPAPVPATVGEAVERFLADPVAATTLGFYRDSPALEVVFHQDRLLQRPLATALADTLAAALGRVPGGWEDYDAVLDLVARLTNPFAGLSLWEAGGGGPSCPRLGRTRSGCSSDCTPTARCRPGST